MFYKRIPDAAAQIQNLLRLTKEVYGADTIQYVMAYQCFAKIQSAQFLYADSYKSWLKAYDQAKSLFGSEYNQAAPGILMEMSNIKACLGLYDEAYKLLDKAKKVSYCLKFRLKNKFHRSTPR
jgi:tetratricopeptide (TPR) repeat protein